MDSFYERHDFNESEINVLRKHFPNTEFEFIPVGWIYKIDTLLRCIKKSKIKKVQQLFGYLVLIGYVHPDERSIIEDTEKQLYFIDKDIFNENKKTHIQA
jgi:hypothetical protein